MHYPNSCNWAFAVLLLCGMAWGAETLPNVSVVQREGRLDVKVGDETFGTYVYRDTDIPRPYWTAVHAPVGAQVTRTYPPIEGRDKTDHATFHPGIWHAYGDINGVDFWRNKGKVVHQGFVVDPKMGPGYALFTVENAYMDGDTLICREMCRYTFLVRDLGYFLLIDSTFMNGERSFTFGDQEEMGLGVRIATPITVENGGSILNSEGGKNEEGTWGKAAAWCDYRGTIDGVPVGIALMSDPSNFRPAWFHSRDYGLVVANPFGRNAMTGGEKSAMEVAANDTFKLVYGVFIHSGDNSDGLPAKAYEDFLKLVAAAEPEA